VSYQGKQAVVSLSEGKQAVVSLSEGKQAVVSLSEMQHADVQAKGHDGVSHIFSCVPVNTILAKVQAPAGQNLRGKEMSLVVIAGAKDGYYAAFALAELHESIGNKPAFVCDKQDSQPLNQSDGPIRLVVPSDKRPARWVRMLTTIDVVQAQP
jgi:hypothetical protein